MVLSKDIKDDTSNEALRKVWGSREDFEKSMLIMAEDMYPDQKSSLYDDSNIEITEEELEAREREKELQEYNEKRQKEREKLWKK